MREALRSLQHKTKPVLPHSTNFIRRGLPNTITVRLDSWESGGQLEPTTNGDTGRQKREELQNRAKHLEFVGLKILDCSTVV